MAYVRQLAAKRKQQHVSEKRKPLNIIESAISATLSKRQAWRTGEMKALKAIMRKKAAKWRPENRSQPAKAAAASALSRKKEAKRWRRRSEGESISAGVSG